MTPSEPGNIVLVRFPFTNLTSVKQRPAVVISPRTYSTRYSDVVVMALTSQQQTEDDLFLPHWEAAGLVRPTWFKPLLATVASDLVVKHLGELVPEDWQTVTQVLRQAIAPPFWEPTKQAKT